MDPVSHLVLARSLEYARRRGPTERGQTLAVVLGALAPDLDAALMLAGWDRYLAAHEIGTHAVAGTIVCGVLAAGVTRVVRHGSRYRALLTPALIGSISHLAGDLLSGAAVRVGWPLVDARVQNLGTFAMADPFVMAASAITLLVWARLPAWRRRAAIALIVMLALGVGVKSWFRARALDAYAGGGVGREGSALVEPVWASWTRWSVFDQTATSVRAWRATAGLTPEAHVSLEIPRRPDVGARSAAVLAESVHWETVRNLRRAHDLAFATIAIDSASGETRVMWSDIRYCAAADTCAIRAGGVLSPSGQLQLVVQVGDWVQTR